MISEMSDGKTKVQTLPCDHAQAMQRIDLSMFRGLLENGHGLDCYCPGCRQWAHANLPDLVRQGLGDRLIRESRPRCRKCGSSGEWQVRPPVPRFDGARWMQ
jgi:hypothetical protein